MVYYKDVPAWQQANAAAAKETTDTKSTADKPADPVNYVWNDKTKAASEQARVDAAAYGDQIADPVNTMSTILGQIQKQQGRIESLTAALAKDPTNGHLKSAIESTQKYIDKLDAGYQLASDSTFVGLHGNQQQAMANVYDDPSKLITKSQVPWVSGFSDSSVMLDPTAGKAGQRDALKIESVSKAKAAQAKEASRFDAATVTALLSSPAMQTAMQNLQAQQGSVSPQALIQAITQDPRTMASLQLEAQQITDAQQVQAPNALQLQPDEVLDGSAMDWAKINETLDIQAAQANPSVQATVQGQLADLMQDFEGGETPPWAAGAMRQAAATMAQRGLGASSMAGAAVVQAAMEAATPIASADAQTFATFELQNLNNRQQVVMLAAQQRAQFLGQEFDQEFQTKVLNAQRIGEIANTNFTAEQQIALENSRLAQSVDLANLQAANAKILADAAAMSQLDMANLANRQQAAVVNAQSFLQVDLANLNNAQQTELFRGQMLAQSILSDQAARNAAEQFNASSENQVNSFFASMAQQVSQFNATQRAAAQQFNAGQKNTIATFNANMANQRQQFNATNALVVAQANAQWRQSVKLTRFAAQHESNMQTAKETNALTAASLDTIWQRERDLMDFAFRAAESSADRRVQLMLGDKDLTQARISAASSQYSADTQAGIAAAERSAENQKALGGIFGKLLFGGGGLF
jgi:hypothetical protein